MLNRKNLFVLAYDNSLDAFVPEQWAMESVALLTEKTVAAQLVHRDFEPLFAKFGDTVNTRQPAELEAYRKTNADEVTDQDVSATNIPVVLNQHIHTSFLIKDGEETLAMKDMIETYLEPAANALARKVDRVVLGQYPQFLNNYAGTLGGLTSSNVVDYITDTREVMERNFAHSEGRQLILGPTAETKALQNATFHQADRLGDDGTAMREASLGRKFGFNIWQCQNMASINADSSLGSGAVNNAAGYPKGATTLTVDGFAMGELVVADAGKWITIGGRPYQLASVNADPATSITLTYGLKAAVADNDVISVYDKGAVNEAAGYAAGYVKTITIDGVAGGDLSVGQFVTFGTQAHRYTVIKTNGTTTMELDRPLEAAITDDLPVNFGPTGDYNLAFHRNAMTLAIRPLKLPRLGAGAVGAVANYRGLTVRVVIGYDTKKQAHRCTLDFLAGIKVLDTDLGAVMLT